MEQKLQSLCEQFIQNRNVFKETFTFGSDLVYPVCSMMCIEKDIQAEKDKLLECKSILKGNTSSFSNFRSHCELPIVTSMYLSSNPEEKIKKTIKLFEILKQHFSSSDHLVLGAMIISEMTEDCDTLIIKANNIYKAMKKLHPFLTSSEDIVYCLLLAISEKNEKEIIKETEKCYDLLKSSFSSANSVQALSHTVTLLDGSADEKCGRTIELFNDLKAKGYKYGTNFELATLGLLANLSIDNNSIIENFIKVDEYLKIQKGYNNFLGASKQTRYMHIYDFTKIF